MKKTLQKILTLLLVITMLFGITATAVAAANEPQDENTTSSTGGVETGWCKIEYDENGVVIELNPDVQAILGVNREELSKVLDTLIAAAKALVIDDLKLAIKEKFENDNAPDSGGVSAGAGTTADNIWEMAITGYIGTDSVDAYVDFLKNVLVDDDEIAGFVKYATGLMIDAVNIGIIDIEDLPKIEDINSITATITDIFKNKIDSYVDDIVKNKLPTYIDTYVKLLQGESVELESSIIEKMDNYVSLYVQERVEAFITANFEAASTDSVDVIISDYMNAIIVTTVDSWISAYINGDNTSEIASQLSAIQTKLNGWISDIATKYPNGVKIEDNPLWDALGDTIEEKADQTINDYITKYFENQLADEELVSAIEGFIHTKYTEFLVSDKDEDKAIINSIFEEVYKEFWTKKTAASAPNGEALTGLWLTIDNEIKTVALDSIKKAIRNEITEQDVENLKALIRLENSSLNEQEVEEEAERRITSDVNARAEEQFANLTLAELKAKVDENKSAAKEKMLQHDLTSAFTYAEWKIVWDGLDPTIQATVADSIKTTNVFKSTATDLINSECTDDNIKSKLESWKNAQNDVYDKIVKVFIAEAKASYADLIAEKIRLNIYKSETVGEVETLVKENEKLVLDVAKTIATLKGVFAGENVDKAALAAAVKAEANKKIFIDNPENPEEKIVSAEFKQMLFNTFLGYNNSDEVVAKAGEKLIPTFIEKYKEAYNALVNNVAPEFNYETLIEYVDFVKVNEKAIYENAYIQINAITELISEIPNIADVAEMTDEQMQLVYNVLVKTDFAEVDFDITLRLGKGFDKVRSFAKLFNKYVKYEIKPDGAVVLDIRVPAKFAEILLDVCETEKLPDSLKEKVYALISGTPDDAVAFLNTLTLDDLVKLIDYIPVERIINSKYLEDIEKLDGLTAEQIKEKVLTYREEYKTLIGYVNSIYDNYVPAGLKNKTLASFYENDGVFALEGSQSFNFEKILTKLNKQYGALISSFFETPEIPVSIDLTVEFTNVKKVEYIVGGEAHRIGFLPVGADVYMFSGITTYGGKAIVGWQDWLGNVYYKMPNKDIKLYPVLAEIGDLVVSPGNVNKVYDGVAETLTAVIGAAPEGVTLSYQWYKDGVAIEGATNATYVVKNVLDSGVYTCVVNVTDGKFSIDKTSNAVTVAITKRAINLNDYTWKPESFVYDGTEKAVYLVDAEGNNLVMSGINYSGNTATNAGTYTATVAFDANNFVITGIASEFEWVVNKAVYDMSGVSIANKTVVENGEAHSIYLVGTLPEGVVATYSENSFVAPGTYTITVSFTGNPNYEAIPNMTATLRILRIVKEHANGNLVNITAEKGIPENYVLQFKDVTTQYNYVSSEDIFGENNVGYVLAAYDIYFTVDAATQSVSDNFLVKLLIPENLRASEKTLKVVHIADNGRVEDMDATREGDYFIFSTTHFSVYAIVAVDTAPVEPKDIDLTWLWVILAIIAVAAIVVVIIILIKKRKGGDTNGDDNTPVTLPTIEETVAEEPAVEETVAEEPAVEETVAEEPAVEETVAEEPAVEETVAEEPAVEVKTVLNLENAVGVRYRTSFMSRLIQAEETLQDYYTVIKNLLLSYKGVKARSSWNFESFNKGRVQCAKLNIKGSALQVYLALDPNEYNANKYHFTDVADKPKLDQVPMLLKVKSDRALKYTVELIEEMMQKLDIQKAPNSKYVDYHMPYETTEALAERELVKVILPKGVTLDDYRNTVKVDVSEFIGNSTPVASKKDAVEEPAVEETVVEETVVEETVAEETVVEETVVEEPAVEEPVEEILHLDAKEADKIITDEEAVSKIEVIEKSIEDKAYGNKFAEINLDTICENFEEGETVNLKALKAKRLVNKSAGRLKVLARGTMTKKLTIYADKYSIQAVKMISLAGGHAEQYK